MNRIVKRLDTGRRSLDIGLVSVFAERVAGCGADGCEDRVAYVRTRSEEVVDS